LRQDALPLLDEDDGLRTRMGVKRIIIFLFRNVPKSHRQGNLLDSKAILF
jgi:hypothetical protein